MSDRLREPPIDIGAVDDLDLPDDGFDDVDRIEPEPFRADPGGGLVHISAILRRVLAGIVPVELMPAVVVVPPLRPEFTPAADTLPSLSGDAA